ncbi:MAG TPA: ribosome biogenesis GTP-binding protein YihA/YsxC [Polyangiaceae bacterium]|jgi:GTP-binding protein|nr:ribosome biogenesis GTP-binding protein YihA/YsxC [Polyangiaceae bacterium]
MAQPKTAAHVRPDASRVVSAEFAAAAKGPVELPPPTQIEIAFAGRSNVGKSSLLNRLMNRKNLARTSSTPGCTRQINFFTVRTSAGMNLSLVDLPGYGYAKRSKDERKLWAELIDTYLLERPTLRAVAVLVDVRRGLEPDDLGLVEMLETGGSRTRSMKTLIVATKLDKLRAGERAAAIAKIKAPGASVYGFSTELPETVARLWSALELRAGFSVPEA